MQENYLNIKKKRTKFKLISQMRLKNEIIEQKPPTVTAFTFTPLPWIKVVIPGFMWKINNDSKLCPLHIYNRK